MSLPPDVRFHRYFQTPAWQSRGYRGKHSLEGLDPPQLQPLLDAIQEAANEGFNSAEAIPQHVEHGPFHFDYIDSDRVNAFAFRRAEYSFIGVTIQLVYRLWGLSSRLSCSEAIAQPSGVHLTLEDWREALRVVFFQIALRFVALHEWAHHVHGHVDEGQESAVLREILDDDEKASVRRQVFEVDADCYAASYILAGLSDGLSHLLKLDDEAAPVQDEVQLACSVVGTGAVMFVLSSGPVFDRARMYEDPHPPQAARMNCLMYQAGRWRERHRPDYAAWMPIARFQTLMRVVAEAAFEVNPSSWNEQTAFLSSEDGIAYMRELDESLTAYKLSFQ
jgi:hypothetical protein